MSLTFYPYSENVPIGTFEERLEALSVAAESYKAIVLDVGGVQEEPAEKKILTPRDYMAAYNWEEIAKVLREIRELPEMDMVDKARKSMLLRKLAEIYEVLRAAKMPKLEAVRLALVGEANQLVHHLPSQVI